MLEAASAIIYPYVIPMLLGRTFDVFTAKVGMDIFSQDTVQKPVRIFRSYITSDFRLIRNDSEARSFLGISEETSLQIKSGVLNIGASGDYLRDIQTRDKYVEILVKSTYETFTETMHGSSQPIPDWDLISPSYLGSHYVRSLTYGGILLASLRLYVTDKAEKEALENYLTSHLSVNEVRVSVEKSKDEVHFSREMNSFEEKLEKMMFDVQSKTSEGTSLRIKYYSTVTAARVPQDIRTFLSILEDFPFQAQKTNGGKGVPVTVELIPLIDLSAGILSLKPNLQLKGTLSSLEEKFNDLLLTHDSLQSLSNRPISNYGKICKVRDLGSEVHDKLDVFKHVIQQLNTASPESVGLSERAIQAYEQKGVADSYFDRFKHLQKEMEEPNTAGGNINNLDNCLSPEKVLEQYGYLVEMSMANGVCASANKFSGSFITMRRNCTSSDTVHQTCTAICNLLQIGPNFVHRGECVGVVAAQLKTAESLGAGEIGNPGEAIGAQTANLGKAVCDRPACFREFCCCRLTRSSNGPGVP